MALTEDLDRTEGFVETVSLAVGRRFSWGALVILVGLQFVGNLAALPLLRFTDMPVEPAWAWLLWTAVSFVIVGIGLYLGGRVGLGAPLLEGRLRKGAVAGWSYRILALSLLVAIVGSLPFLLLNLGVSAGGYPPRWQLVLASLDAGVQEEIFSRLFLVTLLAWLGGLVWRDEAGRPSKPVLWAAIILSGLAFGWAHVDEHISDPQVRGALAGVMLANSGFGVVFGWLYWTQGLESAMLAHFLVDAVGSAVVMPAYLAVNRWQGFLVSGGLLLGAALCCLYLVRQRPGSARPQT